MPKTVIGRASVGFALAVVAFFAIQFGLGQSGPELIPEGEGLYLLAMFAQAIAGVIGLCVSLIAVFKTRDRSLLVYIAGLICFISAGFTINLLLAVSQQSSTVVR